MSITGNNTSQFYTFSVPTVYQKYHKIGEKINKRNRIQNLTNNHPGKETNYNPTGRQITTTYDSRPRVRNCSPADGDGCLATTTRIDGGWDNGAHVDVLLRLDSLRLRRLKRMSASKRAVGWSSVHAVKHRLAACRNKNCWWAFKRHYQWWPWITLNSQNRGFFSDFAIFVYGTQFKNELR